MYYLSPVFGMLSSFLFPSALLSVIAFDVPKALPLLSALERSISTLLVDDELPEEPEPEEPELEELPDVVVEIKSSMSFGFS